MLENLELTIHPLTSFVDENFINNKIPETKRLYSPNSWELTSQLFIFTHLLTSFLSDVNSISLSKFLQNCVCSTHFQSKQFVFHLRKSSNIIKLSFVKISFAKIKLIPFNLHRIVFHIFLDFHV